MDLDCKQVIRKFKIDQVTSHCFISIKDINHVLLIIDYTLLKLINLANFQFKIMVEYKISHMEPLDIVIQGTQNLFFLCKNSIYRCSLNDLINKMQPKRYDSIIDIPQRIICLSQLELIVVYSSFMTFLVQGEIIKKFDYPIGMDMKRCIIDHQFDKNTDPFMVVPHQNENFPYVFSLRQLFKWSQQDYLQKYLKICQEYYHEDEILSSNDSIMTFSSSRKLLYICLERELLVLECKSNQYYKVDYFLKMKMRINMDWKDIPYSCALDYSIPSTLIYADIQKVTCIIPEDYLQLKKKIRQKQGMAIKHVYSTSNTYFFLISRNDKSQQMKLYIAKF